MGRSGSGLLDWLNGQQFAGSSPPWLTEQQVAGHGLPWLNELQFTGHGPPCLPSCPAALLPAHVTHPSGLPALLRNFQLGLSSGGASAICPLQSDPHEPCVQVRLTLPHEPRRLGG